MDDQVSRRELLRWSALWDGAAPQSGGAPVSGQVVPKSGTGHWDVLLIAMSITEKTTVTQQGFPPGASSRQIDVTIETEEIQGSKLSMIVPFTPGYTSPLVQQQQIREGESSYHGADITTLITLGPFTSEFPPDELKGGR